MMNQNFMNLQLGGIINDNDLIGVPNYQWTLVQPKDVYIEGNFVLWSLPQILEEPYELVSPEKALDRFIRIKEGSSSSIREFISFYGGIGICSHGLPFTHNPGPYFPLHYQGSRSAAGSSCMPVLVKNNYYREPLEYWWYYTDLARAILNLAAEFNSEGPGKTEDWAKVLTLLEFVTGYSASQLGSRNDGELSVYKEAVLIALIDKWLLLGDVRPSVNLMPRQGTPFHLSTSTVFGSVGVQLMLAIFQANALVICSGCGHPYLRTGRRPQKGRNNYCFQCGQKASNRDRQRRCQEKIRAKKRALPA